ncbi:sensor histidine kinase [Phytomonospora endophytica]|uniref:Oxygen sensor histidine kinase NreB n=1 Tax=Phytomonospora endophytica TaxID=714109 RepID=A0A841FNQ3_9ACTN|nr:sensor histidine kinase [Phytomonospora endophytica]MBB6033570.1 signal transduction histidine kinase [Phytomonospora endophytica]GIG64914.1 two-component sensor histidine kinase [Phytomonospora endophytica]
MTSTVPARPVALALLRRAQHVLFAALLLVGLVRTLSEGRHELAAIAGTATLVAWYLGGVLLSRRSTDRRLAACWLFGLAVGWTGLSILSADFVWVAFPLFLLCMQMLPMPVALWSVAGLTAVTVAAIAWHRGGFDVAAALGPVIGAVVAVVITVVYRDLRRQNETRDRLLAELTAARDRLAVTERRAGTLAERERLAREIHDTVAQSLASIILVLRSAREAYAEAPEPARRQVDAALGSARDALEDTRRLVRALAPAELDGGSLPEALRRLVTETEALGLDASLVVDGDPALLPTPLAVALLRTAQGALANVRAHAGATRVAVTLTFQPGSVAVDVADDGKGFDPARPSSDPATGTGMGLAAMRDRLAEVGGRLLVESEPGGGTAVNATVPREGP